MRPVLCLALVLLCLLGAPAAHAQEPATVDPYQILHGHRLGPGPALSARSLELPPSTVALLRARTDMLLQRVRAELAPFDLSDDPTASREAVDFINALKDEISQAQALRDRGQYFAAQNKASILSLAGHAIKGVIEAALRHKVQTRSYYSQSALSRVPEMRARLDALRARLDAARPASPSALAALYEAYGGWVGLHSLLALVASPPPELWALLQEHNLAVPPDRRDLVVQVFVEPIAATILREMEEEIDLVMQAGQSAPAQGGAPMQEEGALRRLATAYERAAHANFKLVDLRAEVRQLPQDKMRREIGRFMSALIEKEMEYLRSHRREPGQAEAMIQLAAGYSIYEYSLSSLAWTDVLSADGSATEVSKSQAIREALTQRLSAEWRRAQDAMTRANGALGGLPVPTLMNFHSGQQLSAGGFDERELALLSLVSAAEQSRLVAALWIPPAQPADGAAQGSGADVEGCIEKLSGSEISQQAEGFARNRGWAIPAQDLVDIIRKAVVQTCTRAKDLSRLPVSLFWHIFKQRAADWFRAVAIEGRAAPKLTASCEEVPSPAEDLMRREACDRLRQVMGQLSNEDKKLLEQHFTDGLTYGQIGQPLGLSEDAVRKRVRRILDQMRDQLKDIGPDAWLLLPRQPAIGLPRPLLFDVFMSQFERFALS